MKKSLGMFLAGALVLGTAGTALADPALADPFDLSANFKYEYRSNQDRAFHNPDGSTVTNYGNRFLIGINFDWKATDSYTLFGRFAGEISQLGNTTHDASPNDFKMDEFGVKTTMDGWNFSVGRQGVQFGQGGLLYIGIDWAAPLTYFDGVVITNKVGNVDVKAIAGRSTYPVGCVDPTQKWYGADLSTNLNKDVNFGVAFLNRKAAPTNASAAVQTNPNDGSTYWGAYTTIKGSENLTWTGEYIKSNASSENNAYDLSATYKLDEKNRVTVQYNYVKANSVDLDNSLIGGEYFPNYSPFYNGYKGEYYNYHHTFNKTVSFNADYYALKPMHNATGTDGEFDANVKWHF